MFTFFQVKSFFSYWLNAVDEHSLHSPFLYDLYTQVLKQSKKDTPGKEIEKIRQRLLANKQLIPVVDHGAGSRNLSGNRRRIGDIARTSLSPSKYARLYRRLMLHTNARTIIELGTSLGVTTLYINIPGTRIFTFEGSPAIAEIAQTIFTEAETSNVHLIDGNINKTLPDFLMKPLKIDAVIMDANHRYTPTIQYFEWLLPYMHHQSILILDDIHYSKDMERAWREISQHHLVYATVDLYRCGLAFFDPSLNKQHVVLQY